MTALSAVAAAALQPTTAPVAPVAAGAASSVGTATAASGAAFDSVFSNALGALNAQVNQTDSLAEAAASGNLKNVEDYMISATETQLDMQLAVAVRNKAVEAFNEILRMQI
ncbi:MAG: flagellar hook-basal body complex protein FliE [Microthrixaceae bacterium]